MNKKLADKILRRVGSKAELARQVTDLTGIKCTRQAVWLWFAIGKIPEDRLIPISKLTGIAVEELRK